MSLLGDASIRALLHDLIETEVHRRDREYFKNTSDGVWLRVPRDISLDFINIFPSELSTRGDYLLAPEVCLVRHDGPPEEWDIAGTMASFSAGSEVAKLRRHQKAKTEEKAKNGRKLPPPPDRLRKGGYSKVKFKEVKPEDYFIRLLVEKRTSYQYHSRGSGAGGRLQWKPYPVRTTTKQNTHDDIDGDAYLESFEKILQSFGKGEALRSDVAHPGKTKPTPKGNLRRYTVNSNPAHARAILIALQAGYHPEEMRQLFKNLAGELAGKFEQITGRRIIGTSIHWDSNLPHFNFWHTGIEPVEYSVEKRVKMRYRRTAWNLNSSGGMIAWERLDRALMEEGGLASLSPSTKAELDRAIARCLQRQGREPGDLALNRFVDAKIELELLRMGLEREINQGLVEWINNERNRYEVGIAGFESKSFKQCIERKRELEAKIAEMEEQVTLRAPLTPAGIRKALQQAPIEIRRMSDEQAVKTLVKRANQFERIKRLLRTAAFAVSKGMAALKDVLQEVFKELNLSHPQQDQKKSEPIDLEKA